MAMKRMLVLLITALMLAACGGAEQVATEPPLPTERPEPTARPTATTAAAAPTAEPTTASVAVGEGEIPPPLQSQPYVEGEDPLVDAAVQGMRSEFENQELEGFSLRDINYYTSDASVDAIQDFYDTEMENYGWGAGQAQDEEFGRILLYLGPDFTTVGMIGILDMSTVDSSLEGNIVFTTVGEATEDIGGELDTPTEVPAGFDDLFIPTPPGSETYVEGSDPVVDAAVEGMRESFSGQEGSGLDMTPIEFFVIDETADYVADFYDDEMDAYGWDTSGGQVQDQDFGKVIVYPAADDPNTIALIGVLDMATVDPSLSGLIIFTTIGTASEPGGSTNPGSSAGDIGDIPLPDDATEVQAGEDEILDMLIGSMEESLKPTLDEENMSVNGQGLFRSPSTFEDLINFYRDEMTVSEGWTEEEFQETEGATVMIFTKDQTQGAVIMVMDGEMFLQEENIILIMDVAQN